MCRGVALLEEGFEGFEVDGCDLTVEELSVSVHSSVGSMVKMGCRMGKGCKG